MMPDLEICKKPPLSLCQHLYTARTYLSEGLVQLDKAAATKNQYPCGPHLEELSEGRPLSLITALSLTISMLYFFFA